MKDLRLKASPESVWWYDGEIISFRSERTSRLLKHLQSNPKATIAELSSILGINHSAVQKQLKSLSEKGYITRTPTSNDTPEFLHRSKGAEAADVSYLDNVPFDQLSQDNFEKLRDYYLACRDRANYNYYTYLARYGIKGSTKPLGNEGDDLTHKLAIAMGIKALLPIDDHQTDKEYNQAWVDAVNSGTENGDLEIYAALTKKAERSRIFPALTGQLGKFTSGWQGTSKTRWIPATQPAQYLS